MDTAVATTESTPAPTPTESSATATAVASRPTSAIEAFKQVTATPDPAPATDTAAIAPGATDQPTQQTPGLETKGPIPFDVHHKALDNARTKAVEDALTKHRAQWGWAETVDRAAVEQAAKLGQLYQTDRSGYVKQLLAEAVADPDLAPVVRSEAARILGASRPASPDADPEPDVPVYDGEGKLVNGVFSGKQQLALITALRSEIADLRKQVSPLAQSEEGRQKAAKADADKQALDQSVSDLWAEALDVLPHFEEHKEEIGKVFATIPGDAAKALRKAWKQVVGPKLDAKAEEKTLNSFKQKAAAQTVDGSGIAGSTPPARPRNPAELAAYMRRLSAKGS